MERIEMVEKLRERANITMEEAKEILDRNNWDMLDAMVELEKAGKINNGANTTSEQDNIFETVNPTFSGKEEQKKRRMENRGKIKEAIRTAMRIVLDNKLLILKNKEEIVRLPLIIPVIATLCSAGTVLVALIVGMAFGFRYELAGKIENQQDLSQKINETMNKAGEYAQNIVNNITEAAKAAETETMTEEKKDAGF